MTNYILTGLLAMAMAMATQAKAQQINPKRDQAADRTRVYKALSALPVRARADRADMVAAVVSAANKTNVDALWLLAVSFVESRHNRKVIGDGGRSFGPYQITMSGARVVAKKPKRSDLHKWRPASMIAGKLWRRLFDKYGPIAGPVVYNCGPVRCKLRNGKQRKSTPATRAYWKYYKLLQQGVEL